MMEKSTRAAGRAAFLSGAAALFFSAAALAQQADISPVSAAASPAAVAQQGDGRKGTFKTVQGDVTIVRGQASARSAATVGAGLRETDRILTGANSSASLILQDGTIIAVGANSTVDLSQFEFNSTTHEGNMLVSLARGSMRMVTGLMAKLKPEQVRVTTPTSIIGVRGTDFIVEEL